MERTAVRIVTPISVMRIGACRAITVSGLANPINRPTDNTARIATAVAARCMGLSNHPVGRSSWTRFSMSESVSIALNSTVVPRQRGARRSWEVRRVQSNCYFIGAASSKKKPYHVGMLTTPRGWDAPLAVSLMPSHSPNDRELR
jgi:hypothetical protein